MEGNCRGTWNKKLRILAEIIEECEDKLICDLAETYHILNYRELSPETVAVLSLGLRRDSRVKMHFSKEKLRLEEQLLADIADSLRYISWTFSKDAHKGRPYKGRSLLKLLNEEEKPKEEFESFRTVEEYDAYMKQFEK